MQTFDFAPSAPLGVVTIDGAPWFIANDVLSALGHPIAAHSMILRKLDSDEFAIKPIDTKPRRSKSVVSESGLYKLLLRSDMPDARASKKWVTSEVLPTIRKTGGYMVPAVAKQAVEDPAVFLARALANVWGTATGFAASSSNQRVTILCRMGTE